MGLLLSLAHEEINEYMMSSKATVPLFFPPQRGLTTPLIV